MGISQNEGRMEGWLYLIRSNRFGLQYSRKRYFVLQGHHLRSFKSVPASKNEVHSLPPILVELVVTSTDEEAKQASDQLGWGSSRFLLVGDTAYNGNKLASVFFWGLRLFKEAKDREYHGKWDDHPAIMAVGVVDGTSEAIFKTLMSLGPSRSEWDFCFYKGSVIEHVDGHTDIVHKLLNIDWLPWGMKRRDLLLQRYWRREDDGTYGIILYHSVSHKNCSPQKSYVRACLKSGGYVVSPMNQGKQSVVKHTIAIDWKFWKSYLQTSSARSITIRMLGRVAALRELFRAKVGDFPSLDLSSGELTREIKLPSSVEDIKDEVQTRAEIGKTKEVMEEEEQVITASEYASLVGLDDAADEFFDVSEPLDYDQSENDWCSDFGAETYSQGSWIVKQSVGKKACLVGQALEINYFHGKNYLEANAHDELPEHLLGTCRLNHLDVSKAVSVKP
ncbi:hypothetical protein TEA_020968 [Camellia sinensis var. sinensis]|uniref:START domain-containing protein n=1 Tax=Camellia sinensis var. sinensis TaxID=542762 RepID=A0A4S4EB66_CAMSN|nr:hypothetical protein TEA_020968 [Camellia sinensis var. sinensis]